MMNRSRTLASALAGLTLVVALPALASPALASPALAMAMPVKLAATLNGANEPAGGDADGTGAFAATVDPEAGKFCYTLSADNIDQATMAHVHSGPAGQAGPPVITVAVTGAETCMTVEPDKLAPILADPAQFHVNVHNAAYPAGAIRGQLTKQ